MKQLLLLILLTLTLNVFSQTKKDSTKQKYDTVLVLTYTETTQLLNWIDSQHADHQSVKDVEKFISDRIKIYKK